MDEHSNTRKRPGSALSAALLLSVMIVLTLGCIGTETPPEPPTTTLATSTTTSSTTTTTEAPATTTTSTTTTVSTLPKLPDCDKLHARFWRALCYDEQAYDSSDAKYCRTVYCKARLEDGGLCGRIELNTTDWVAFKERACEAWVAGTPAKCRGIIRSGECARWFTLLAGNFSLCQKAENTVRDDCSAEFAFWRGEKDACDNYNTIGNKMECEANYFEMAAMDNRDPWYCNGIRVPKLMGDCKTRANWTGPPEKHPLYGLKEQLLEA